MFSIVITAIILIKKSKSENLCKDQVNCGSCLRLSSDCSWCKAKTWIDYRCNDLETLKSQGCEDTDIVNELSSFQISGLKDNGYLKITPAIVNAIFRPNGSINFNVTVNVLDFMKVHLGIILDNSFTMKNIINKLKQLTVSLAGDQYKNIFSKLGVSMFVDKLAHPIIDISTFTTANEKNKPFDFRIISPLTNITSEIAIALSKIDYSSNLDIWEDSLEAIAQTVLCKQFGWIDDPNIIHTVMVYTDALPKTITAGYVCGVYKPHDMNCHVDKNLAVENGLDYDYLSFGQVGHILRQTKTEIVLAVTPNIKEMWKKIADSWTNVKSYVIDLNVDQSEIVDLLTESRNKLNSKLELFHDPSSELKITITPLSSCPKIEENSCSDIVIGGEYEFNVKVDMIDVQTKKRIKFSFSNILGFELNYEPFDDCSCDDTNDQLDCQGASSVFHCGICECPSTLGGTLCECPFINQNLTKCTNPMTGAICSNHGICTACSVCSCFTSSDRKPYTGPFCQCGETNCKIYEGEKCGGDTRGKCVCDECVCEDDYFGDACENIKCDSKAISDKCINPGDEDACSGNGTCICGKCVCKNPREGEWCEKIIIPIDCDYFKNDVFCFVDPVAYGSQNNCSESQHVLAFTEDSSFSCVRATEDKCKIFYNFIKRDDSPLDTTYIIHVKQLDRDIDCEKPINVVFVTIGVFVGIFAVGLLLFLIYFISLYFYYRAEFKKFSKEVNKQSDTQQNPLYETGESGLNK